MRKPDWKQELDTIGLMKALNWFNVNGKSSSIKRTMVEYLKSVNRLDDANTMSLLDPRYILDTEGWIAQLLLEGHTIPETSLMSFNKYIREMLHAAKNRESTDNGVPKKKKASTITNNDLGWVEYQIDLFLKNFQSEFSMHSWILEKDLNKKQVRESIQYLQKIHLDYYVSALQDRELFLGYGYTRPNLKKLIKFIETIIYDCNHCLGITTTKKTVVKNDPKVSDVKSAEVDKINGAKEVWFVNTKTFHIGVYKSRDNKGLQLVGQTIQNFDQDTSIMRVEKRKFSAFTENNKKSTSSQLKVIFDSFKSKIRNCNGNLNKHIVIYNVL